MTKRVYIIISLMLCFALLAGCAGRTEASVAAETAETEPEPPSTEPDPTAVPEKNGMYDLLAGVFDTYHFGTAGSSLTAARYAASIVDWGMKNGEAAVVSGARAWDRGTETEYGESFGEKLGSVYAAALSLYGAGTGVLSDCGWEGEWDYSARDVHGVFEPIFPALGLETPLAVRVYYPDAEVMYLRAQGMILDRGKADDAADMLNTALTGYVFSDGERIEKALLDGTVLTLDLSDALAAKIRSYGTSGELLTVAAIVNTALDAVNGAEGVLLTVRGAPLETGHNIYDGPIGFYEQDYPGTGPSGSAPQGLRVEFGRDADTVTEGTEVLFRYSADRARVMLPASPEVGERINAVLEEERRLFEEGDPDADGGCGKAFYEGSAREEYASRIADGTPDWFIPYDLERKMDVSRGDGRVLSLTIMDYTYSGGAHGYGALRALNFDLNSGETLRLEDLTDDPEEFIARCGEKLLEISRSGEYAEMALGGYFPGYEDDLPGLLRDGNWYFDAEGITVIANPYEIAPYAYGRIEFTLPYEWLRGQIRDEYLPEETDGAGLLYGEITDTVPGADDTVDDGTNAEGACVLFRADGAAEEVRITRVSWAEYGGFVEDGTLWYASRMEDGGTLLLRTWFGDVFPTLKIGWRRSDGQREDYLLFQSGKDGSLVMTRDETAYLPLEVSGRLPFSFDLDGDGETEVLDLVKTARDGASRWQLTVDGLPAEDTSTADAQIISLWVADLDADGTAEILFSGDMGSDDYVTCAWRADTLELIGFTGETRRGADGSARTVYADGKAVFSFGQLYLEGWNYQLGTYAAIRAYGYSDGVISPEDASWKEFTGWSYPDNRSWLTAAKDLPVTWTDGSETTLPAGTQILLRGSDGDRAFFVTEDDRRGSIVLEYRTDGDGYSSGWTIDGVPEGDYFRSLPYAG